MWDQEVSKAVTTMKDKVASRRASMKGVDLYMDRCAVCHGEEGAGDGLAAERLYPKPRDFTLAMFKYNSSPPETLPKDSDLFLTIKKGLPGTGMPGWGSLLSDKQINSLIPVIKGFDFTAAWAPEDAPDEDFDDDGLYIGKHLVKITQDEPLTGRVAFSEASAAKGKPVFEDICGKCHGLDGRGNITSGKRLQDDWGNRLWPRDLTKPWTWRWTNVEGTDDQARDATIAHIYERLSIGIPGTPMPAHRDAEGGNDPVSVEDRWHIANYVYTLRGKTVPPNDEPVVIATPVDGNLPVSVEDAAWGTAPGVTLPLVPNIIKEPRLFTPLNNAITVRALYNQDEIAFLLEINDRTDSRPGEKVSTKIHDEMLPLHPDAFAIQFPKDTAYQTAPVVVKPLYRHGDSTHPTTIWYLNAGAVEPAQPQRSTLLDASGPDAKIQPRKGDDSLTTDAVWDSGRWKVLMKRPRQGGDSGDVSFREGDFIPISFANWDGNNGEIGSRHTLTTWYWLVLPPKADPARTYGIPAGVAAFTFLLGLAWVRNQRRQPR
jgi:DMSO reductase family type II enzyme heme b subunit